MGGTWFSPLSKAPFPILAPEKKPDLQGSTVVLTRGSPAMHSQGKAEIQQRAGSRLTQQTLTLRQDGVVRARLPRYLCSPSTPTAHFPACCLLFLFPTPITTSVDPRLLAFLFDDFSGYPFRDFSFPPSFNNCYQVVNKYVLSAFYVPRAMLGTGEKRGSQHQGCPRCHLLFVLFCLLLRCLLG